MFTGIVEAVGTVRRVTATAEGRRIRFDAAGLGGALRAGDSVAVNGVCLTVERTVRGGFEATAVGETLRCTTLGGARAGTRVNLERAARPDTALGGHIVQGHVDGVGRVRSFRRVGKDRLLEVELPETARDFVVPKGSITIDGTSLTVVDVLPSGAVTITIVPHTLDQTIAGGYRAGTRVNVEADVLAKYVREYVVRLTGGAR